MATACYAVTAFAAVAILVPFVWPLALPAAAAGLVMAVRLHKNYRTRTGVVLCALATIGVLVLGLAASVGAYRTLREAERDEQLERQYPPGSVEYNRAYYERYGTLPPRSR